MDKRFFKAGEKVFNLEPCAGDSDLRDWAAVFLSEKMNG